MPAKNVVSFNEIQTAKMIRDAQQKSSLRLHFWQTSLFIFGRSYFVRALEIVRERHERALKLHNWYKLTLKQQ